MIFILIGNKFALNNFKNYYCPELLPTNGIRLFRQIYYYYFFGYIKPGAFIIKNVA